MTSSLKQSSQAIVKINLEVVEINQAVDALKYVRFPMEMLSLNWATSSDAIVYAFMLNRYTFFRSIDKPYFENLEDVATGSRQSIATVKRSIKKLQINGFIDIRKIKVFVGCSNNYTVNDIFGINDVKRSDKPKIVPKSVWSSKPKISRRFIDEIDLQEDGPF
jgi:hypothetical protein